MAEERAANYEKKFDEEPSNAKLCNMNKATAELNRALTIEETY